MKDGFRALHDQMTSNEQVSRDLLNQLACDVVVVRDNTSNMHDFHSNFSTSLLRIETQVSNLLASGANMNHVIPSDIIELLQKHDHLLQQFSDIKSSRRKQKLRSSKTLKTAKQKSPKLSRKLIHPEDNQALRMRGGATVEIKGSATKAFAPVSTNQLLQFIRGLCELATALVMNDDSSSGMPQLALATIDRSSCLVRT